MPAAAYGITTVPAFTIQRTSGTMRLTPAEHGVAGADDAAKHLADHMPGWLLEKLGDALLAQRDVFSSDDVRREAGATVNAWLEAEEVRRNTFSGWFMKATRRHKLVRVGTQRSQRENRRGAWIATWRFP